MAYKTKCRICKKVTDHVERIVSQNLPAYVKTLECLGCGVMGVVMIEDLDA